MRKGMIRLIALIAVCAMVAVACGSDSKDADTTSTATTAKKVDYTAVGLWDDGPCDTSKPELKIGLMTVFESPVVSLSDQAVALEAAAKAFNARGGANGSCIEVTTCDDGAQVDQAVACVGKIDEAGVVATVNDQGTAGQAEVSTAMSKAGIPRVASNVAKDDWGDPNAYPLDPSGTGGTFMHPASLASQGVKKIGLIRVDLPAASALVGLLKDLYADDGVTFVYDVPVPAGTTDYSQFVLGAEDAGAQGVTLNLGEQEAIQIVRAAEQLKSDLKIASGLGTFSQSAVSDLGEFSKQMVFDNAFPPATFDLSVYDVMRADLAASGDKALQPQNMRTSPIRSWIGLYALLWMIRDTKLTDFTRDNMTSMLRAAKDVPMLGMFGDENWTPNLSHEGLYKRAGMNHYSVYRFDPDAKSPAGITGGNFVATGTLNWDEVMCGSIFGSSGPC